ncbi:MAG: serine/threonine-protein kinase, partial [Byssovorax sp.]
MIGTLLASRYRLQALLGQGGMGVVHQAIDETTGARVAVKLVHAEMIRDASTKDDVSKLTRFLREAKAAAAIQGEHVARTLDWGTDESTGQPFIVMELLEGEDLSVALKRVHVLPPDVALRIAAQACEGLLQAHLARVTHRDIKPANLFLARTPTGEIVVKILDFGIAKIRPENDTDGETTALTRTGSMLGSPKYMSPEQARGSRTLDARTDLWSLGVVMHRAL